MGPIYGSAMHKAPAIETNMRTAVISRSLLQRRAIVR
jgi:hypothetical protein